MATQTRHDYQYSNAAIRLGEVAAPGVKALPGGNKAHRRASAGYVLFVTAALIFTALVLVHFITLRSEVTNKIKNISTLEAQLNDLKLENDATYSRINSNMDLEQIRDTAIRELGMTYAKEGQIETFTSENGDYVRQIAKIGQ